MTKPPIKFKGFTRLTQDHGMNLYTYYTSPIDFWMGWLTEKEYLQKIKQHHNEYGGNDHMIDEYRKFREAAFDEALLTKWEGDIREGPFITAVPMAESSIGYPDIIIAFKQENNGDTMVVSPVRLPFVEDYSFYYRYGGKTFDRISLIGNSG